MTAAVKPANPWHEPDRDARAHSDAVAEHIRAEIERAGGWISFARYMELALYAPGLGYYQAGARRFGAGGDFVTAPELSPLFAACLARQCAELFEHLDTGEILEFGGGSGILAAQLIDALERIGRPVQRYRLLETSPALQAQQRDTVRAAVPEQADRVEWIQQLPDDFAGVVLANEVLDAFPVHCFRAEAAGLRELGVTWERGRFQWSPADRSDPPVANRLEALGARYPQVRVPGYTSEVNLWIEPWIAALGAALQRGAALLIDYGYTGAEYYHPQRVRGTLRCHYRHHAHDDPFVYPGLQDITAHVDFSAVAQAAAGAGLDLLGYTTQANFLVNLGLDEHLQADGEDEWTRLQRVQQARQLIHPNAMGESFKVIALGRDCNHALRGFGRHDLRHGL